MPRRFTPLTAAKIKTYAPGEHADGNGLSLKVSKSGARSWLFRYRFGGKRHSIGLGSIGDVSLKQARDKTLDLRAKVRDGVDPKADTAAHRRGIPSFKEAALAYIALNEPSWKNPKHRQQWRNSLEKYVYPIIGNKRVDLIESHDVVAVLEPIWRDKPETARRVRQRIAMILDREAVLKHRPESDPTKYAYKALPKQGDRVKHHNALPYADMPALIKAVRGAEKHNIFVRLGLEWLILTATRTTETRAAQWHEIADGVWTIPAERMKADREHRVPLPDRCMQILDELPRMDRSPYLFPGRRHSSPLSQQAFTMLLRRLDYGHVTVHGFRSTFRDWAAEKSHAPYEVCEAALAHTVENKVEAAYRRTDFFDKRRALMAAWSSFIASRRGDVLQLVR